MKINHHESDFGNKPKLKPKNTEINIPEKITDLKKYNKDVDISKTISGALGSNLNFSA